MLDSYHGIGFGLTAAKDLLDNHHILAHGERYGRRDIASRLVEGYLERGGSQDEVPLDPARAIKKLLPGSGDEERSERFKRLAFGKYEYIGQGTGDGGGGAACRKVDILSPDLALGEGAYEVYAWCLPQDEGTGDRWPIKIGFAGEGGFHRRWQMDFATHLPVKPRYLRSVLHETDAKARSTERFLHEMLGDDGRGRRVQDVPNKEWFHTSPDEIDQILRFRFPHLFAVG